MMAQYAWNWSESDDVDVADVTLEISKKIGQKIVNGNKHGMKIEKSQPWSPVYREKQSQRNRTWTARFGNVTRNDKQNIVVENEGEEGVGSESYGARCAPNRDWFVSAT